jgi:hypothetical protein
MVNTSQQVGGAIGTALLNTIAASATTAYATSHAAASTEQLRLQAMVHGYATAIWWAVGILALASLIAFTLVNGGHGGSTIVAANDDRDTVDADDTAIPVLVH